MAHSVNCFSSGAAMAQYVNFVFFWSSNDGSVSYFYRLLLSPDAAVWIQNQLAVSAS
jgi:hypothetical protein